MKALSMMLVVFLLVIGCNNKSDTPTEPEQQYHTFTIQNLTTYAPKQLTSLEITPVNGGTALTADFICNVGIDREVKVPISATSMYKVKIYAADGESMWWDSVGLSLPGQSMLRVTCGGSPINFWVECASLPPSGTDMK
jgi:Flp pilus assembly protein TadG